MDGTTKWKKTLSRCVSSSEVLHNECLCCLYQRIYISIIILKGLTSSLNICVEIEKEGMEHIKECNNLENQKSLLLKEWTCRLKHQMRRNQRSTSLRLKAQIVMTMVDYKIIRKISIHIGKYCKMGDWMS